ncbi:MAG: ATP-binding protein [bacterium]|nr:ATP-binding protein [bacterium]
MNYLYLINLDVFFLGISSASIGILGFVVFLNNRKSVTNKTFLLFSILTICWSGTNFLVSRFNSADTVLWLLRFAMFFAVWHAFSFFHLFFIFPQEKAKLPVLYRYGVILIVLLTSVLCLTPLVFTQTAEFSATGQVASVTNGPGIALFGIVIMTSILGGLAIMLKKMTKASAMEKIQFQYILLGSAATFLLLVVFNFILPAFFDNARFVPLGAFFILPFAFFTAYAIIRHHLLNVKVIATETLTYVLAITSLVEVIISQDVGVLIFRLSTFLLILALGTLLIRSVRKEVEQKEKLEELSRAKSEFMSIASHQLRTPLSIVKGYISLMQEGSFGETTEKQREVMQKVYTTNEGMMNMVNDLLNVTRAEEGRLQYTFEDTDLRELATKTVESLRGAAAEKKLELISQLPSESVLVSSDKEKLGQVISNLVDNAIKYTPQGSVTVQLSCDKGMALVKVQDTGLGIGKEEMGKLFESFSRGTAATKSWTKGTGMGLYVAKKFVQAQGGRIWVESEGEGKGSTFFVEIPLLQKS